MNPLDWYKKADVKFKLINYLYNRELALLAPGWLGNTKLNTRCLRGHNVQSLDYFYYQFKMFEKKRIYNFYYSMATYKSGVYRRSFTNPAPKEIKNWNKYHYESMSGYDYLLDIDSPSHNDMDIAFDDTKRIKKLFDWLKVPYELRFSGCGFHFIIPYIFLPMSCSLNPNKEDNLYKLLSAISKKLYNGFTELIDYAIYDSRRVCKIPYSLAVYENKSYVCWPFESDMQFKAFKLEKYNPDNINDLRERRGLLFNPDGSFFNLMKFAGE